jgi:hypothetical protein
MQIDFHHTATYVLARLAGFRHDDSCVIAYSAQYVDDATNGGEIRFINHEPFDHIASAHPVIPTSVEGVAGLATNFDNTLNAEAWIPFHFLPGNGGLPAGQGGQYSMRRRLICQRDSPVAKRMVEACVAAKIHPNGLHRLGITAHVFADTFVHYDFVGLKDGINRVRRLLHDPEEGFHAYKEDAESQILAALPLGHGMVLTLPDQPFRKWGYVDRDGHSKIRENQEIFMHAAERLLDVLCYYRGESGGTLLEADRGLLRWAFAAFMDEDEKARHRAWMDLLAGKTAGRAFSFGPLSGAEAESLRYLPKGHGSWKFEALKTEKSIDDPQDVFTWSEAFETSDWKRFHEALKEHRAEVMDKILAQEFGLSVNP